MSVHKLDIDSLKIPFTETVRQAGKQLLEAGKLRLQEGAHAGEAVGRVPFFRRFHTVHISVDAKGRVEHDCTCPHTANTGEGCPHLFALLLALREQERENKREDAPPLLPSYVISRGRGPLAVSLWEASKKGGRRKPMLANASNLARIAEPRDARIFRLLAPLAGGRRSLLEGGGFLRPEGPYAVPPALQEEILSRMEATGRLVLEGSQGRLLPLRLGQAPPRDLVLALQDAGPRRQRPRLTLHVTGPEGCQPLDDAPLVVTGERPLVAVKGTLAPLRCFGAEDWLAMPPGGRPVPLGNPEAIPFMQRLARSGPLPRIRLPGSQAPLPLLQGRPQPRLRARGQEGAWRAQTSILYGRQEVTPAEGPELLLQEKVQAQIQRDLRQEGKLLLKLLELGFEQDLGEPSRFSCPEEAFLDHASRLLEEGWEVWLDSRPLRHAAGRRLHLAEDPGGWLEVRGGALFGNKLLSVEKLLQAWREKRPVVKLEDGSLGLVPADWPATLGTLLELGEPTTSGLRFHKAQGPLIAEFLSEEDPQGSKALASGLKALTGKLRARAPAAFQGHLRPYQEQGLAWLAALEKEGFGGCLADDMGLGKTVQVIAFLAGRQQGTETRERTLLVVPRSLIWNWQQEMRRFAPHLELRLYGGPRRQRHQLCLDQGLWLTTYGTLRQDQERLRARPWDLVILDEAQAIKNPASQISHAVFSLEVRLRLSLTGTPVENHLQDIWSQMQFLNPGLFGPRKRFLEVLKGANGGPARMRLAALCKPLVLRRRKEEVLVELPKKTEQILLTPMGQEQAELYWSLRKRIQSDLLPRTPDEAGQGNRMQILEGLLRLRQAACHPALLDPELEGASSGKLELLMPRLEEVLETGHQALVFSQFTSFLSLIRKKLQERDIPHAYLDGRTRDRRAVVTRFQEDPRCAVLLASLKVGGVGLNLTAADYVFLMDPWWNPAVEAQAVDRAHRLGQTRPVMALRLVAEDTVEEKMLDLQRMKRGLLEGLLEPGAAGGGPLKEEDLRRLLFS